MANLGQLLIPHTQNCPESRIGVQKLAQSLIHALFPVEVFDKLRSLPLYDTAITEGVQLIGLTPLYFLAFCR